MLKKIVAQFKHLRISLILRELKILLARMYPQFYENKKLRRRSLMSYFDIYVKML